MKSRVTTYVLIAAVTAVWGFIAWKIFFAKPDVPTVDAQRMSEPEHKTVEEETLILDYPDPFLKDAGTARPVRTAPTAVKNVKKETSAVPQKKPNPTPKASPLKYTGTIGTGGRVSYLIDHDGLQHALVPGEEVAGYSLTEAFRDSVRFTKDGETFTLLLEK